MMDAYSGKHPPSQSPFPLEWATSEWGMFYLSFRHDWELISGARLIYERQTLYFKRFEKVGVGKSFSPCAMKFKNS